MSPPFQFISLSYKKLAIDAMQEQALLFYNQMKQRRSVRHFSKQTVPVSLMEQLILTAGTAPSGANKQPWTFCLVGTPSLKKEIRMAAEREEYKSYHGRMPSEWLQDLEPLGTRWEKPFLEEAPWLIVLFKRIYEHADGSQKNNYYVNESAGIAAGFLIAAIHQAGLCTLTHTPSPMDFLARILHRPSNERAFLLLPVGYPAEDEKVPDIKRKSLSEILVIYDER